MPPKPTQPTRYSRLPLCRPGYGGFVKQMETRMKEAKQEMNAGGYYKMVRLEDGGGSVRSLPPHRSLVHFLLRPACVWPLTKFAPNPTQIPPPRFAPPPAARV